MANSAATSAANTLTNRVNLRYDRINEIMQVWGLLNSEPA